MRKRRTTAGRSQVPDGPRRGVVESLRAPHAIPYGLSDDCVTALPLVTRGEGAGPPATNQTNALLRSRPKRVTSPPG